VVLPLRRVWVSDLDEEKANAFALRMTDALGVPVEVAPDLEAAVARSWVTVTCTTSHKPILGPGIAPPGAFIAAVGADNPGKHEIDPELMRAAKVVVDSLAQCTAIGDLHHALAAGVMTADDVHGELAQVVAGSCEGRRDDNEVIIFDSTGTALQDVAAAALIYRRALEGGRGSRVELASRG